MRPFGTELLHRCESYLAGKGAKTLFAGPMAPHNPFYLGLYGGVVEISLHVAFSGE